MNRSQENVLAALRANPGLTCKYDLVRWMQSHGRWAGSDSVPKRICELIDAGYQVDRTTMCAEHDHQARCYGLVDAPVQLVLS